jgi:hypothetical protein
MFHILVVLLTSKVDTSWFTCVKTQLVDTSISALLLVKLDSVVVTKATTYLVSVVHLLLYVVVVAAVEPKDGQVRFASP